MSVRGHSAPRNAGSARRPIALASFVLIGALGCAAPFRSLELEGCNAVPLREEGGLLLVDVALGDVRAPVIVDTGSALSLTLTPEALARVA